MITRLSFEGSYICNLFGGADSEQKGLEAQASGLSRSLQANYGTEFADQQDALKMLNSTIQRISSGQTGPGFGADELAARTGQIVNQSGANARNVEQAEANQSAGQIFGGQQDSSGLARASAVRQQLTGEAESAAETQKSNALENLTAQNYQQGRVNAAQTAGGLEALAGQYGGAAGTALSGSLAANKEAATQENQIYQENNQASALVGGLLKAGVGIAGSAITGGISNLGDGGWDLGAFAKGAAGSAFGG
jgi:hypothetical protein